MHPIRLSVLLLLTAAPALAQTASEVFPAAPYFQAPPGVRRGPNGARLDPDPSIVEALKRRELGLPPAPPPPQPARVSQIDAAWMQRVQRAIAHSSSAGSDMDRACRQLAEGVAQCRLNPVPPAGLDAVDVGCLGRNLDNRDWQGEMAGIRGMTWIEGFFRNCQLWLGFNQAAPLRR